MNLNVLQVLLSKIQRTSFSLIHFRDSISVHHLCLFPALTLLSSRPRDSCATWMPLCIPKPEFSNVLNESSLYHLFRVEVQSFIKAQVQKKILNQMRWTTANTLKKHTHTHSHTMSLVKSSQQSSAYSCCIKVDKHELLFRKVHNGIWIWIGKFCLLVCAHTVPRADVLNFKLCYSAKRVHIIQSFCTVTEWQINLFAARERVWARWGDRHEVSPCGCGGRREWTQWTCICSFQNVVWIDIKQSWTGKCHFQRFSCSLCVRLIVLFLSFFRSFHSFCCWCSFVISVLP